jgi:hypothetical protein
MFKCSNCASRVKNVQVKKEYIELFEPLNLLNFFKSLSGTIKQTECQSILGWQASADVSGVACVVNTWTRLN